MNQESAASVLGIWDKGSRQLEYSIKPESDLSK